MYFEQMIDEMKYSDEEDDEDDGHLIKGAAQFLPPRQEKKGSKKNDVNMNDYFDFFQNKYPPKIARYCKKWQKERKSDQPAIRMRGKAVGFTKDKDENEEEEWPAIFEDIYYKRMQQLEAHHDRKKRQELETKEFSLD